MPFRSRCIEVLALAALSICAPIAALALPASANAVTITESDIEPGVAHVPERIASGPDGLLYYTDGIPGSRQGVGRMTTAGVTLPPLPHSPGYPEDLSPGNGFVLLATFTTDGLRLLTPTADIQITTVRPMISAVTQLPGGTPVYAYMGAVSSAVCVTTCAATIPAESSGEVTDLAVAADGSVWAVVPVNQLVLRLTVAAGTPSIATSTVLPANTDPLMVAVGPDGNAWVASAVTVDRITPAGAHTSFALPAGTLPQDIAAGPDGAIWIASRNGTIVRMTTAGQVTNVYPTPTANSTPWGITTGPDGALWFTERALGKIGRLVPDPAAVAAPGGKPGAAGGSGAGLRFLSVPEFKPSTVRRGRTTRLLVTLSAAARLKVTLGRATTGRRVNGTCVKTTRRNRSRSKCTRYPTAKTVTKAGVAGANSVSISTRGLGTGTYRATVTAGGTTAAGRPTLRITARSG